METSHTLAERLRALPDLPVVTVHPEHGYVPVEDVVVEDDPEVDNTPPMVVIS